MPSGTCSSCGADLPPDFRFCPRCGTQVESEEHGERRLATVVFADIVASTETAVSMDPEDLRERLTSFFTVCRSIIEDCGGRVEKFIGDAVMAVFGVPRAYGDDVDRAVTAALRLVDSLDVTIRVGVNTGEVYAVDTGPGGDVAVTGEAVNAAARLQAAAAPGQVLLGERTARSLRSLSARPVGVVEAKGFPQPIPVWEPVERTESHAPPVPFVGRHDDLRLLSLLHDRCVRRRTGHLAVVVGDPGSGKTRLATEFLARVSRGTGSGRSVLLASSPVRAGGALPALATLARALCDAPHLAPDELSEAVAGRLRGPAATEADVDEFARRIAISTGDEEVDPTGVVEDQVTAAWARLLRVSTREQPLTVVIDDAQWADEALLQILTRALGAAVDAPLFVLLVARSDPEPDLTRWYAAATHIVRLELLPLDESDARQLAAVLLATADEELVHRAVTRAAGNPFFLTELARVVGESAVAGGDLDLPDTVQSNVVARLDALPEGAKHLLQLAAVVGPTFTTDELAALGAVVSEPGIDLLVRREFLHATNDGRLSFHHALIREVAYAQLSRSRRADLHERIAGAAEAERRDVATAADHMLRAARLAPSADRAAAAYGLLRAAADDARRRGHARRAQQLLEDAAEVAADPLERLECLQVAAWAAWARWDGDAAVRLFLAASDAAATAGEAGAETECVLGAVEIVTRYAGTTRRSYTGAELADLVARAERRVPTEDRRLVAYAAVMRCWLNVRQRSLADDEIDHAVQLAGDCGDARIESLALDTATAHAWSQLRLQEAARLAARRGALADRVQDPVAAAIESSDALVMAADTALFVGDLRSFRTASDALRAHEEPLGNYLVAYARQALYRYLCAEWDEQLAIAEQIGQAWVEAGRPTAAYATPGICASAAVAHLRGIPAAEQEWTTLAAQIGPGEGRVGGQMSAWLTVFVADADLHLGDPGAAIERLDGAPEITDHERRPFRDAVRAEAAVLAGDTAAETLLTSVADVVKENRYARATWRRAAGLQHDDLTELRAAYDEFCAIGATYQAARTGYLLSGDVAREALDLFARLRVPAPRAVHDFQHTSGR